MRAAVAAVMFDFDHTLGVDNKLEEEVLGELARDYCSSAPDGGSIRAVLERYRYEAIPLSRAIADGMRSFGCRQLDVAQAVTDFRQRCLALAPVRLRPLPGTIEMLRTLGNRDMPMAILSNGWTELQHLKAQLVGFPGPVLASEEIDAWKPDVRAFDIALERFRMASATTLYVGDNPRVDVAGAKSAGMLAAWADFESKPFPVDVAQPDLVIRTWRQFIEALDARGDESAARA